MESISHILAAALVMLAASTAGVVHAEALQPYVLAYTEPGPLEASVTKVKDKLSTAGFELIGEYSPYAGAHVVAITNADLKSAAGKSEYGGFGAVQHVAVTQVDGQNQISYLNLRYLAAAYRLNDDLSGTAGQLEAVLGAQQKYGTEKGRTPEQLKSFNYMVGMERFDDFYQLGRHSSYEEAVRTVEANLRQGVGGTAFVYKLEIPGKKQTVFGVSRANVSDKRANDKHIMADTVEKMFTIKTTPYLPYQMMVNDQDVIALHMRFRMAVWHPDLTMGTFGKLISSPGAIEELFRQVAGGKRKDFSF
ncbi:hypothetical protein SAMN04488120_102340 [Fontimonas thermophila]|uniref:Uncharacterized protein n=1 Tax=Fontimonas thermophila TaxID=1076937 RepID=A0A1I2I167_9GAMM|nr:hypothetical protein [Fontimonas thermophila]SFF34827.1 hypothetical protein SAMN04488120_102340 [Fontimonas thermophila]